MSATAIRTGGLALRRPALTRRTKALRTLAKRRAALTAHNPRQIAVPLLTPILFATVIAPALSKALGGLHTHIDYIAFVSVGTVGLLVPLAAIFAGLSVIVDRDSGAQKEPLAAPIPRALPVLSNRVVVLALAAFQVVVLIAVAALRGGSSTSPLREWRGLSRHRSCSRCSCTAWPRRSRLGSRAKRSTSPPPRWSQSCRSSSPVRCSQSTYY